MEGWTEAGLPPAAGSLPVPSWSFWEHHEMPGVGKGVPVSEKGSQARTEAGACLGLTKASTRTCVLTSRGQEGLYTTWSEVGTFGTYSQMENIWPLQPLESLFKNPRRSPSSCRLSPDPWLLQEPRSPHFSNAADPEMIPGSIKRSVHQLIHQICVV